MNNPTELPAVRDVSEEARQRGAQQAAAKVTEEAEKPLVDRSKLVTIRVLRSFVFTHPPRERSLQSAHERRFDPKGGPRGNGDYELNPEDPEDKRFLEHPWIKAPSLADGKIESAAQRRVRLEDMAQRQAALQAERDASNAASNAAIVSAEKMAARGPVATDTEEMTRNLNTPINELRASQGLDVHTPMDQLRAAQGGAPMPAPPKTPDATPAQPPVSDTRDVSAEVRQRSRKS